MLATASAVVADILDCVKHKEAKKKTMYWEEAKESFMKNPDEDTAKFFIRTSDAKENVENIFAVSEFVESENETVFVTEKISQKELDKKLSSLKEVKSVIRVLEA